MGKYGNQRSWGHKDTAKDGGSKSENVRGAQNNNKTERPRGAEAKSGGIDVTSSTLTPMQATAAASTAGGAGSSSDGPVTQRATNGIHQIMDVTNMSW